MKDQTTLTIEIEGQAGRCGMLALTYCGKRLPLQVMRSPAGYYIGTSDECGPVSRESNEYFRKEFDAQEALNNNAWTQKQQP